jgi:hypothetical protein
VGIAIGRLQHVEQLGAQPVVQRIPLLRPLQRDTLSARPRIVDKNMLIRHGWFLPLPDLLGGPRHVHADIREEVVDHRKIAARAPLPVAVFYSLFVDYYVSSLTGAVKE